MLRKIVCKEDKVDKKTSDPFIRIKDSAFPKPFKNRLEFNPPVHENWNIVHTGMLIPGSHEIYICPQNCMRGVSLTAAEMGKMDRFSAITFSEEDILKGDLETQCIESVSELIEMMDRRPSSIMIFLVCAHHFVGVNEKYIYTELEKRYRDIFFFRCWMDPIMAKDGIGPELKERAEFLRPINARKIDDKKIYFLLNNFKIDENSEIIKILKEHSYNVFDMRDVKDFEEFKSMGDGRLYITNSPSSVYGLSKFSKRIDRDFLYMPLSFTGIEESIEKLLTTIQIDRVDLSPYKEMAMDNLSKAKDMIGDYKISIDSLSCPRPLSLARLLLDWGFNVISLVLDEFSLDERDDYIYLKEHYKDLLIQSINKPENRLLHNENKGDVLAIGPKAAWFYHTRHFVNIIEGVGLLGYYGIYKISDLMMDAYLNEKDTRKIVPRKGLGCSFE